MPPPPTQTDHEWWRQGREKAPCGPMCPQGGGHHNGGRGARYGHPLNLEDFSYLVMGRERQCI